MNTKEVVIYNILKRAEEIVNNPEFKKKYPDIQAGEYLYAKLHNKIKLKRLLDILGNKAEKISLREINYIADALNVPVNKLFESKGSIH